MRDDDGCRKLRIERWREQQDKQQRCGRWAATASAILVILSMLALLMAEMGADSGGAAAQSRIRLSVVGHMDSVERFQEFDSTSHEERLEFGKSGGQAGQIRQTGSVIKFNKFRQGEQHDLVSPVERLMSGDDMSDTCTETTMTVQGTTVQSASLSTGKECEAQFIWPVHPAVVVKKFNGPAHRWEPGHRGVDIAAVEGTPLTAPASGFISFAGIVAGKSVVSIRHGRFTLTFEPAQTELPIGTPLVKGAPFATVVGLSDHCTGVCVHWGVKDAKRNYTDPARKVRKEKIVLKPLDP